MAKARILFVFLSLALILSMLPGCSPSSAQPTLGASSGEKPAQPQATEPAAKAEKVLRMINFNAPVTLNVHLSSRNADSEAARLILEPLAAFNDKGEPVPILAEEVPTLANGGISADLKTTTWKLKKGIKWSDGTDFTADDVVFTWQFITNPKVGSVSLASYSAIEKVEAIDPNTVKITWKQPNSEPLIAYAALYGPILQKKQFEKYNNETASQAEENQKPIGTGPFMVTDAKPGDTYVYVRNPMYRDASKVYFDKVILKGGGDAPTAARAVVQTGEYDYAFNLGLEKEVMKNLNDTGGKGQISATISSQTTRIALNHTDPSPEAGDKRSQLGTEHPILKDLKVRQALVLAIDRGALVEQLLGPTGAPTCNWANPPYLTMQHTKWGSCGADVEKAKALLEEAGWKDTNGDGVREKDGKALKLLFLTTINPVNQKMQEFIKAAWEQIGVSTELKAVQSSVFGDKTNPDSMYKFYADAQMFSWGGIGTSTTARYLGNLRCSQIPQESNGFGGVNVERWCYPDYDKMYDEFLKEGDPVKHDQLGSQMQDMYVDDVAGIPLAVRAIVNAVSNSLVGPKPSPRDLETWNIAEWYMK
jgi:peptide/nickel transport system substrate-binding protein